MKAASTAKITGNEAGVWGGAQHPRIQGTSGQNIAECTGGATPPCKGIDPTGVLRRFEVSSRPLGGKGPHGMFPAPAGLRGSVNPLRGIQAGIPGLQILTLRGIQQKAPACEQALRRAGARWWI